jgi:hypothetical protein
MVGPFSLAISSVLFVTGKLLLFRISIKQLHFLLSFPECLDFYFSYIQ